MKRQTEDFIAKCIKVIGESERHCYITRIREVQKESLKNLKSLLKETAELRKISISQKDEERANLFLGIDCMINSLISELQMYGHLKNGEPSKAWFSLIDAQDQINGSLRASLIPNISQEGYARKLLYIEKFLFPPQSFSSPSMSWGRTECSICKKDYDECNHIGGEAYMGEFCSEIVHDIKFLSLSLVSHPADKRRVIQSFSEGKDGMARDFMTWKLYKEKSFDNVQKSKTSNNLKNSNSNNHD